MVSSKSLFVDTTYLHSTEARDQVDRMVMQNGDIPLIDWSSSLRCWVFHTLLLSDGTKSQKPALLDFIDHNLPKGDDEKQIENTLAKQLKEAGKSVVQQHRCAAGIIDILTDDAVYEVKSRLTRSEFFHALGQVIVYRESINFKLQAVIVGRPGPDIEDLVQYAGQIGVHIVLWETETC